ncbi:MAG TPA: hypothetical protein PKL31_10485 [Fulvivirga sp.]|nr:hypothetical protein [Fulvivirga sp.]
MGEIIHQIYLDNELQIKLESAALYDTLSPYRMVANSFYEYNQQLKQGAKLRIISNQQEYLIETEDGFRNWVKTVFNSPYNGGFEKYLNKKID